MKLLGIEKNLKMYNVEDFSKKIIDMGFDTPNDKRHVDQGYE